MSDDELHAAVLAGVSEGLELRHAAELAVEYARGFHDGLVRAGQYINDISNNGEDCMLAQYIRKLTATP